MEQAQDGRLLMLLFNNNTGSLWLTAARAELLRSWFSCF
ncbi:hypothetical protein FLM9_379 [Candidatus Synechococcus spongiarum]|uniref:Uncharacterized protein n=1 Tax=Candidatus Synechococcus spongiarum TaxID=431041 RepID=A0A165AF00_9SYNE|nr:hypothetical protein FLM9_379 [Candidatus Synechococcus spongiarum]